MSIMYDCRKKIYVYVCIENVWSNRLCVKINNKSGTQIDINTLAGIICFKVSNLIFKMLILYYFLFLLINKRVNSGSVYILSLKYA